MHTVLNVLFHKRGSKVETLMLHIRTCKALVSVKSAGAALMAIAQQMLMFKKFSQPMADFVHASDGESVTLAGVKTLIRDMIKFEPTDRCTMTGAREALEALGGLHFDPARIRAPWHDMYRHIL